ncbi:MAG: beta-galactosidase, partial [Lentisphaerota bacterium]
PGEYDASDVDKILSTPLKVNPNFKIILWLGIGEYPEFGFKYPDEIIRNEKGEALIASTHFLRFDSAPPQPKPGQAEHYAISFFSERYRKECAEMLVEFIKTVEASPHGKSVIGYLIGGGQDAQFYSWSPPDGFLQDKPENWCDYSPAARKAFVKWLDRKYGGKVSELNKAWGAGLESFEQAAPPPATDLAGLNPFHDPVKEYKAYDWKRFLAEGRAEILDCFAGAIKKASNKKIIVGATGGDGGHRRDNTSISRLLRSNNLDFFLHQAAYAVRIPPSGGGINALLDSYTVNGKLFLTDMDHRLWTGKKHKGETIGVVSYTDESVGRAADMAMQRDMWRREYARLWVSGNNGAWFNNMGPGSEYDNAELQDEMRFLNDFSTKLIERRCVSSFTRSLQNIFTNPEPVATAEVAFIFDEEAVDYARGALGEFHGAGMYAQWNEANVSGVPIRYYYAQDLRDGKVPSAKLYVFQNIIDIDVKLAERIKEIRKDGATIVLLQGTGMAQLLRGQEKYLDDLLGIKLRPLDTAVKPAGTTSK